MTYGRDYALVIEYEDSAGHSHQERELVRSYRQGFEALKKWLFRNYGQGYVLVSADLREI